MHGVLGHDTGPEESGKKYRPLFLDHFDKKIAEKSKVIFKINIIFSLSMVHNFNLFFLQNIMLYYCKDSSFSGYS